jgi:hypothetical protein
MEKVKTQRKVYSKPQNVFFSGCCFDILTVKYAKNCNRKYFSPTFVIPWNPNKVSLILQFVSTNLPELPAYINTNKITFKCGIFTVTKHTENVKTFIK